MSVQAHYYDGRQSHRQSVRLSASSACSCQLSEGDAHHACLLIENENGEQRFVSTSDIRVSEPQGRAPRTLRFGNDGAFCEVPQNPELIALLDNLGYRDSAVVNIQKRWRWALSSFASVLLLLVAVYLWGLPWCAKAIAPHVPLSLMQALSDSALKQLDGILLQPSKLPEEKKEKLQEDFQQLATSDPALASYSDYLSLKFRSAPKIGPNAFALPDGQIVLLDELIELLDDEEVLAVLAHEFGHVSHRHGIRQLIQSSVTAAVVTAWLGDISFIAASLGTVLLDSGYSREMEFDADRYAAEMLTHQGASPNFLASALKKLETAHQGKTGTTDTEDGKGFKDWISTHPSTSERIRLLRKEPEGSR